MHPAWTDNRGPRAAGPRGAVRVAGFDHFIAEPVSTNEILVLAALMQQEHEEGRCTARGACARLGISVGSSVTNALRQLDRAGFIRHTPGQAGAIVLLVEAVG